MKLVRNWSAAIFCSGFVVIAYSFVVHPYASVKTVAAPTSSLRDLDLPGDVKSLMIRSCADCHSNETVWPWYAKIPPASWLVERDVRAGRSHLNLSSWPDYSSDRKQHLLAEIATVVKNGEMPVPQYTLLHREAKLSEAETDILYRWARLERRRLHKISQK